MLALLKIRAFDDHAIRLQSTERIITRHYDPVQDSQPCYFGRKLRFRRSEVRNGEVVGNDEVTGLPIVSVGRDRRVMLDIVVELGENRGRVGVLDVGVSRGLVFLLTLIPDETAQLT
jgi:hypothetical protein